MRDMIDTMNGVEPTVMPTREMLETNRFTLLGPAWRGSVLRG